MSSQEEVQVSAVAESAPSTLVSAKKLVKNQPARKTVPAPKAVKKVKVPKTKSTVAKSSKTYFQMAKEAIESLNTGSKSGTSKIAIHKYVMAHNNLDGNQAKQYLNSALRKAVQNHELIQIKGVGANGSFKLPATPVVKKTKSRSAAAPKPEAAKPKVTKESAASKTKSTKESAASKTKSAKTATKKQSEPKAAKAPKVIKPKVVKEKKAKTPKQAAPAS